jgi:RNA polymerase sigma-70 factor (ECF subfamily)
LVSVSGCFEKALQPGHQTIPQSPANRFRHAHVYTSEMGETEHKTISAAVRGDRMAFRQLVLDHSHAMFRVAWRLCNDENMAEDIVQESFIKAWRKIGDFRMQSSFRSWMQRITINTAMDFLRKRARRQQFETSEPEFETTEHAETPRHDARIDISAQAGAAMQGLSETERAALMLRHYEGHSIREIAQILELTTDASKQTIFRAVQKMRTALQPLVST